MAGYQAVTVCSPVSLQYRGFSALTVWSFLAVYLHGEPVARVEHAARAVPTLADARLRCAPGLRLAALHAKGDAGYLKGVLSFGQPGIIRQLVLRAGSRCKEYRSYGKKYLNGMSFLHIALFFCSCFVLPPPAKAAVAP